MRDHYHKRALIAALLLLISASGSMAKEKPSGVETYAFSTIAKQAVVTGIVTGANDGQPLPGVNVLIKGTTRGVQTDTNGKYSIEAGESDVLIFSYIGYATQEFQVNNRSTIDIILQPDIQSLSEVVVVGYGTQEKKDVTGSVGVVNTDQLKSLPVGNVSTALQGRAAGVQVISSGVPGDDATITIRGLSTMNNTSPLLVIDGVPTLSGLNTINPDDVESIQVLKDASAAAIYGSRGANGVVIITTKRGKGESSGINIGFYTAIQRATRKPGLLNAQQFAQLNNEMMINNGQPTNPAYADPSTVANGSNWWDAMFDSAPMTNFSVSYSGSGDKYNVHTSLNVFDQQGIVINTSYKRYSVQLNGDYKPLKRLTIGHNLTLNHDVKKSGNYNIRDAMAMVPVQPVYKTDGSYSDPLGSPLWYGGMNNPVGLATIAKNSTHGYNMLGGAYGEYEILEGLKFRTTAGLQANFWDTKNWNPRYDWHPTPQMETYLGTSFNKNITWLWDNTLTYTKTLNDNHQVTVLAGTSAQENNFSYVSASRRGFASDVTEEINGGSRANLDNGGSSSSWALFSYFARVNYAFKDRYLLTATVRRDGSSRFGPDNRFGTFPSISGAWRISEESFFRDNVPSFFDDVKIRAGYGETGNQEIGNYPYATVLVAGQYNFNGTLVNSVYPLAMSNPGVHWEAVKQSNIGIDLSGFNGRVNLILDAFIKNTESMLVKSPVPISTGYNPDYKPDVNAGKMQNKGVEITVATKNVRTSGFTWDTDFNITFLQNKIVSLNDTIPLNAGSIDFNYYIARQQNGHPLNAFYGFQTNGIFQTQEEVDAYAEQVAGADAFNRTSPGDLRFRDNNNDGVINDLDRTFLGNPNPKFILSLNNTFSYKNFDLSIFLQGVYGNDIYNANLVWQESMATVQNQTTRTLNRWTGPGTSNTMPRAVYSDPNKNSRASDRFIQDGSYLRIKNVTLGYNFSKAIMDKVNMKNARIYVSAQNLFTFTNYTGVDPEVGANGIDLSVYPVTRTFSIGANIGF